MREPLRAFNSHFTSLPVRRHLTSAAPAYWLFPGRRGEHLTTRAARYAVKGYIDQVRPMRCHDLRHSAATDALRASGGDVWLTAKMLGHADTRMVYQTYGHALTGDALRIAQARSQAIRAPNTRNVRPR